VPWQDSSKEVRHFLTAIVCSEIGAGNDGVLEQAFIGSSFFQDLSTRLASIGTDSKSICVGIDCRSSKS